ncbi:MAG: PIN domain-containing protein [Candidatus Aminicenantales bacterium]
MEIRKLRVFLDSNVILSGLLSELGPPRIILDLLSLGLPVLQGVTGRYNLTEIERNIAKRLTQALSVYHRYLPMLDLEIIPVPFPDEMDMFHGLVEDKDLPVLASAVMGRADHFITGDKRLLARIEKNEAFAFMSFSPTEFLDRVLPDILAVESLETGRDR